MAEPSKQQVGDGSDNYGQAAGQMAKAARQAGQEAVKQTAAKGAEQAANAAAATVKASVEGGKAVAEIAAGTAAGGPLGAVLSAAWSMRHTLFKVLVCICLALLFLIVMVVSLPSVVFNSIFGLDGNKPAEGITPTAVYAEMAGAVSDVVDEGYNQSLARVEELIAEGGYDYDLSMESLINYAQSSSGYDVGYILAAYSASMLQQNTKKEDMVSKLGNVAGKMFPVTSEEKQKEIVIPVTYYTYKPVTLTVVTNKVKTGMVNGVAQYRYETAEKTYYLQDEAHTSDQPVEVDAYKSVTVSLPVYSGGAVTGTTEGTYYEADGKETVTPGTETVKYIECTIHPFDNTVIATAFGIDLDAPYEQFGITYGEAIQKMATALKMTLYGNAGNGQAVPLTDAELIAFVDRQNCSAARKQVLTTALSLVGKVPYFWGGKSGPGWNDEWNTPKLVTAAGSTTSGTIRPYGLDCSGFTDWTYKTALGVSLYGGTQTQWDNSFAVSADQLLPGDLGFLAESDGQGWNHVLIFAGYGEDGRRMWVHSSSGEGVVLNSPGYESSLSLRRPKDVDFDAPVPDNIYGTPVSTLEVEVTHYCACAKCCGSNASGITASGKVVSRGMVAMSSHYPFGTQIMINGTMYTVEDRGGSGIENNIHRVDIYVPDHNEALRLGRYRTTATIYRLGR
ncbi:NlpC/P60 family protein [uncultured Acetatifactor sp.]|jgi:cell wall-associated NlpC family hydrolase/3D (Asp-Asp-Asp) domain-containing protein|uniref:C40 family peptidase n=1 Tax=uncultured Acetatifactor sp. TaxID=1671927 RepID=UPI00261B098B|nr:NlpC/P60 family protein [uncultured Acetatifactor sp.]